MRQRPTRARWPKRSTAPTSCFGLSAKGALTPAMVKSMAKDPIIFAMANPDPEITPEEVARIRTDAIMATGRSDYPNQVNNVLGFPYIFRGALDVRATTINDEMKVAAAAALAALAREDVPDDVAAAYQGNRPKFGPGYIIPVPFDPAADHRDPGGRRQGGDGFRRGAAADPRFRQIRQRAVGAARPDRLDAAAHLRPRAAAAEARGLRRGRGRAGDAGRRLLCQPEARHGDPGRPRRRHQGERQAGRRRPQPQGHRDHQCAAVAPQRASMPTISTSACSAKASCSATASG